MTIAQYIEQDLESKILSGEYLPDKITLGAIADTYGVSPTPVRMAFECLIQKGLVEKQDNGRLRLKDGRRSERAVAPPIKPVDWEGVLAKEILLLSLAGEAGFLREEALAEKHGIGRSSLRPVLHRLAGGGLIDHVPRRGWRIRTFRRVDMDAFIDIRETLETRALDLARTHLVAADLEHMLECNSEQAVAKNVIDNQLHGYFISKSKNRYIASFFDTHGGYYTALFDYATLGAEVLSEMAAQHRDILQCALDKKWGKARKALSGHIRAQKSVMEKMTALLEESKTKTEESH